MPHPLPLLQEFDIPKRDGVEVLPYCSPSQCILRDGHIALVEFHKMEKAADHTFVACFEDPPVGGGVVSQPPLFCWGLPKHEWLS